MSKKKKGKKKRRLSNWKLFAITLLVAALLSAIVIRASIRMVDDPKDRPRIMKLKCLDDGIVVWENVADDKDYTPGDVIMKPAVITHDSTTTWITEPKKWMVIIVKDQKQY